MLSRKMEDTHVSFYKFVKDTIVRKENKDDWDTCLDLSMGKLERIQQIVESWVPERQMEYTRILETRFLLTQPPVVSAMAHRLIHASAIHIIVRLETMRWWRDPATGHPVSYENELLPILRQTWESDRETAGKAYLFNYIASIVEAHGVPVEARGVPCLLDLLTDMIASLTMLTTNNTNPTSTVERREDFCYRVFLGSRQYLAKDHFTELLKRLWTAWEDPERSTMSVSTRILFIHYLATYPQSYNHDIFPTGILVRFLENRLKDPHSFPWDRADIALVILNLMDNSVTEALRRHAQEVLCNEYESGGQNSRITCFYQNQENIHCVCLQSAQEILDFLHQEYPALPRHGIPYYDKWIRECLERWPQSEENQNRVWTSLYRIQKDYSVHGERRDRLFNIMRLVVNFIKHDAEHGEELKRRFLEEMIDMAGTCSTGFAVRLLNVLSGYRDFAIRIPPEHALRSRFFFLLNKAMIEMEDDEARSIIMDELTLPASHYSERIHFLTFFAGQLPILKEALYEDFRDTMSDVDFDFYLRKCIYHYEGGQGAL